MRLELNPLGDGWSFLPSAAPTVLTDLTFSKAGRMLYVNYYEFGEIKRKSCSL